MPDPTTRQSQLHAWALRFLALTYLLIGMAVGKWVL